MHGVSVTGTGIGVGWRAALVSRCRIAGISRLAWVSVVWRTRISGVSRVAWISVAWGTGISGVSRMSGVTVARLPVTRISISRVPIDRISVAWVAIGRVTVIGARWRRRCSSDTPKYSGCSTDRGSEGRSRPTTSRRPNRSPRSRSQHSSTKAALNGIIWVCAGRQAQRESGNHVGRKSGHHHSPSSRRPA
jgi:hypothetical protein